MLGGLAALVWLQSFWIALIAVYVGACSNDATRENPVDPAHGRQGIGTRLVHTVIDWARSRRFENLTLMTFRHLPWNAPFYAKLGFVPLSTRGDEILDRSLQKIGGKGLFIKELEVALQDEAGIDTAKRVGMRLELG